METPQSHFNRIAHRYDAYKRKNSFYYSSLKSLLGSLIPSGKSVLEIGCGTGELLASLKPSKGLGIDISSEMVSLAKKKYGTNPRLDFKIGSAEKLLINGKWDYVIMVDVVEHLVDHRTVFSRISRFIGPHTKLIITMANPIWEPILVLAEKLRLKMPEGPHRRIKFNQIKSFLKAEQLTIIKHDFDLLIPVFIPGITSIINNGLKSKYIKKYAFIEIIVASKESNSHTRVG